MFFFRFDNINCTPAPPSFTLLDREGWWYKCEIRKLPEKGFRLNMKMIVSQVTYLGNSKFSHDDLAKNWTCVISSSSNTSKAASKTSKAASEKSAEACEGPAAEADAGGVHVVADAAPAVPAAVAVSVEPDATDSDDDLPVQDRPLNARAAVVL